MLEVSSISTNSNFPFNQIANVYFFTLGFGTDKREIDSLLYVACGGWRRPDVYVFSLYHTCMYVGYFKYQGVHGLDRSRGAIRGYLF